MREILLDRIGDAPIPPEYSLIDNEVEFLHHAVEETALFIRGERLCDWAETFYQGRQIPARETLSPTRELQATCLTMTAEQCVDVYQRIATRFTELPRPLTVTTLLRTLYPDTLWSRSPSREHAADWLLWLVAHQPNAAVTPLLASICNEWEESASGVERYIYSVRNGEQARQWLEGWLGILAEPPVAGLGEYTFTIPSEIEDHAQKLWRRQITETQGTFFDDLSKRSMPYQLRRLAALETVRYLKVHPQQLNRARFEQLTPYLGWREQSELQQLLPPVPPSPLPAQPEQVLHWFRQEYLPYRVWEATNRIENAAERIHEVAQQFAHWYLEQYPKALMGNAMRELLSFRQPSAYKDMAYVTLVIVLDGLHVADAQQLRQEIQRAAPRLSLVEERLVFAPLPTVTEFAKEALLRGTTPLQAEEVAYVGSILPENEEPTRQLKRAKKGELYFWRVQEPDRTYHQRNSSRTLARDVESELIAVANKISDLVRDLPTELPLRVVIATDHGRLLGTAQRTLAVPPHMTSHGRAAWGSPSLLSQLFPESGYRIEDQIVYLHSERFGLPVDTAIALYQNAFETNDGKKGTEAFAHGGLYPEEVIVPWLVMARDRVAPDLHVSLSGDGQAGRRSQMTLQVTNYSDTDVVVREIVLRMATSNRNLIVSETVKPRTSTTLLVDLEPWPTAADAKAVSASALVTVPNGSIFEVDASIAIQSEELYTREDVLGDLAL